MAPVESRRVGGQALAFLPIGETGPDVLLLHGFGSDRSSWRLNQGELATFARTKALDLPGHGDSGTDVGDGSIGFVSRQVEGFLEVDGRPAHLVGHSLGGAVAVDLAHRRPDLVRSLFLVAPAGLGIAIDPAFLQRFPEAHDIGEMEELLRGLVARPRLIGRQMAAAILAQLSRDGVRDALRKVATALHFARPVLAEAVDAVGAMDISKHVAWGAADLTNPIDETYLARLHADVSVIKDAGHLPHMENAAEVNRLMRRALDPAPPA